MIESIFSSSYPEKEPAKPEYKSARVEKGAPEFESETNYESVMGLVWEIYLTHYTIG